MRPLIALAAVAGLSFSCATWADDGFGAFPGPAAEQPFPFGKLELVALHDAQFVIRNDGKVFGADVSPASVGEVLKANGQPDDRITLSVSALLVRTGDRLVLLDTGLGGGAGGALLASLKLARIAPEDITDVVITHSHSDHVGGLTDASKALAFPKATVHMSAAEWTYMKSQAAAADLVKAIDEHVQTFTPGKPIAPGVTPVALEGHTPGHMGYEIVSGKHRLLDIGDMAHSSILSLSKPEWTMGFDSNSAVAKATRKATFARLARTKELVFAPHFPFPAVGHIVAKDGAYAWVPAAP